MIVKHREENKEWNARTYHTAHKSKSNKTLKTNKCQPASLPAAIVATSFVARKIFKQKQSRQKGGRTRACGFQISTRMYICICIYPHDPPGDQTLNTHAHTLMTGALIYVRPPPSEGDFQGQGAAIMCVISIEDRPRTGDSFQVSSK